MNRATGRYDRAIRPLKLGFLIATALFLVLATALVFLKRNHRLLDKTHGELVRAKEGLARVKEAGQNRTQALATLKGQLAKGLETSSPERLIYGKVDEIKAQLKPDDMTIASVEKKGGDASLQYTLKFVNPGYCDLLNAVNRLQQAVFPFAPVDSIAVSQAEQGGKGVVEFTVTGTIQTIDRATP